MTGGVTSARATIRATGWPWVLLAVLVVAQICYPLTAGAGRARLVVLTVVLGFALSVGHAAATRGWRTAAALVAVTAGGGLAVEALGVATGVPFGSYAYSGELGPRLAGVPVVIPLAWTWMAWPAWLAAARLARGPVARVGLAGVGLAAWDLFLDPQMVAAGYWTWADPAPALPGVPGVPVGNYLAWLAVALAMMAALPRVIRKFSARHAGNGDDDLLTAERGRERDAVMHALYLWTYASQVLAHAVFLDLPGSAAWGAAGMGVVAVPLAGSLLSRRGGRA